MEERGGGVAFYLISDSESGALGGIRKGYTPTPQHMHTVRS